ncbi:MAG: flagellar basal body rod protein FlgB [Lachnospiraceae bacterium]|nr:flagellar basal body rod protein FlgB [Lachnospiraceae bacterium]
MINSNAFDYVRVLDKAADAAWIRNQVLANNMANINTPGYKRQDINFEGELERALGHSRYKTMDEKVAGVKDNRTLIRTYTDYSNFSYRVDGNNVDIDTENIMLAKNQLKYNGIMSCLTNEFTNLKTAMTGQ